MFWFLTVILTPIIGCSGFHARISKEFLPLSYQAESIPWSHPVGTDSGFRYFWVNQNTTTNAKIRDLWKNGELTGLFKRQHPSMHLEVEDTINLTAYLNRVFKILYIQIRTDSGINQRSLRENLEKEAACKPLSNTEIQFLMNAESESVFPRKPVAILIISSHELMLQSGAKAVYPKVASPYLRAKYHLKPIPPFYSTNLFATKNDGELYSKSRSGFVFCRQIQ